MIAVHKQIVVNDQIIPEAETPEPKMINTTFGVRLDGVI